MAKPTWSWQRHIAPSDADVWIARLQAAAKANLLPPEEQMTRFLQWLKVKDGGSQPC